MEQEQNDNNQASPSGEVILLTTIPQVHWKYILIGTRKLQHSFKMRTKFWQHCHK